MVIVVVGGGGVGVGWLVDLSARNEYMALLCYMWLDRPGWIVPYINRHGAACGHCRKRAMMREAPRTAPKAVAPKRIFQ